MENTIWSDFIQSADCLYTTRGNGFREDNKDLFLGAMGIKDGMVFLRSVAAQDFYAYSCKRS